MAMNRALKMAIAASGLKQKYVASQAGMDEWRLSRILHATVDPRPEERKAIARVLRIPVSDLFGAAA